VETRVNNKVTESNVRRIAKGMTIQEVESILGFDDDDESWAIWDEDLGCWMLGKQFYAGYRGAVWKIWRNGNDERYDFIAVAFIDDRVVTRFRGHHAEGADDTVQWRGPTAVVLVCLVVVLAIVCFRRIVWLAWPKGILAKKDECYQKTKDD
jgi:hypothetical protein